MKTCKAAWARLLKHSDTKYYYENMTSDELKFFKDFIGEEAIGIKEDDFEVYYPEVIE